MLKIKPDIIIVDDQQIFRQGLKAIIHYENLGAVIGEAGNGEEFINLLYSLRPDLVLMDIEMPVMNGFEALRKGLDIFPEMKIIAFSVYWEGQYYDEMMKLGAKGFVQKSSGINELEYAIKIVMEGGSYFTNKTSGINKDNYKMKDKLNFDDQVLDNYKINDNPYFDDPVLYYEKMSFFPWFEKQINKSFYYE